mmetsp:Transcript_24847/g.44892  ORF Transcript_24847/g.44892 Transcript_24847/m.44892 type:complete len:204 (-) Transcript_24847:44-655(-)
MCEVSKPCAAITEVLNLCRPCVDITEALNFCSESSTAGAPGLDLFPIPLIFPANIRYLVFLLLPLSSAASPKSPAVFASLTLTLIASPLVILVLSAPKTPKPRLVESSDDVKSVVTRPMIFDSAEIRFSIMISCPSLICETWRLFSVLIGSIHSPSSFFWTAGLERLHKHDMVSKKSQDGSQEFRHDNIGSSFRSQHLQRRRG